jgi:signal transduction histidine kinase
MIGTYFVANLYATPEIIVVSVSAISLIMILVSHLISQAVNKINKAKRQAEIEKIKTQAIIFNLNDGLVLLDLNCRIILVNPKAKEYLKVSEKDIINFDVEKEGLKKRYPYLSAIFSWCPAPSYFLKKKIIAEEIYFGREPVQYFQVYTMPVINSFNKHLGYIKILHNITREKELDKMKSEFISLTSHQLRGPLSGIKWLLEIILTEKEGKLNFSQKKFLQEAANRNEKMIKLVSELLDVARIERNRLELNLKKVDIKRMLNEVIKNAKPLALKKNIDLNFLFNKNQFYAKIDVDKIKMAFQNLVENAIKYTKEGGRIEIGIKEIFPNEFKKNLFTKHYKLYAKRYFLVSVSDTGIGIALEDKNKIFSRFYRGKRAKEMEAQGTGLGLYIGKQIIEKHKGKIWFESKEGKGATFYVVIPKH